MRTPSVLATVLALVAGGSILATGCGRLKPHDLGGDDADVPDAGARCLLGAPTPTTSTLCAGHPELCGDVCGDACVDLARDASNCGACGVTCAAHAGCADGVCGGEPGTLVAPAPGCRSIRLVHEAGAITWADMGHGTISRIPVPIPTSTTGGAATVLASGVRPAAIYTSGDQPLFVNNEPVAAGIIVRDGTVFWIESPDSVTLDEAGLPHGGAGHTIVSVAPGAAPRTLLPAALAPDASPVSSVSSVRGDAIEKAGEKPPLSAIALSPDGRTLYFGAGTRLYEMPSAGAATADDVKLVGYTSGPEHGFATTLAADDRRLFFASTVDTWIEIFDTTKGCDGSGATGIDSYCPSFVFGSHPIPLLDTVRVEGGYLTWAKEGNVWRADLTTADPSLQGHWIASDTVLGFGVTGFAVGAHHAYFGENELVERGEFTPAEGTGPPRARTLARGQPWPSSFAIDGTNVYWTTTNCDIAFMPDSPQ